jgi:hypothetical protein
LLILAVMDRKVSRVFGEFGLGSGAWGVGTGALGRIDKRNGYSMSITYQLNDLSLPLHSLLPTPHSPFPIPVHAG